MIITHSVTLSTLFGGQPHPFWLAHIKKSLSIPQNILKSGSPKDPSNAFLHPVPLLFQVLLQFAEMHMDTELLNISSPPS